MTQMWLCICTALSFEQNYVFVNDIMKIAIEYLNNIIMQGCVSYIVRLTTQHSWLTQPSQVQATGSKLT